MFTFEEKVLNTLPDEFDDCLWEENIGDSIIHIYSEGSIIALLKVVEEDAGLVVTKFSVARSKRRMGNGTKIIRTWLETIDDVKVFGHSAYKTCDFWARLSKMYDKNSWNLEGHLMYFELQ